MAPTTSNRQLTDLNALLEVSRELGATTELLPLLQKIERAVLQVLDCERGTVFLYDKQTDELYSLVATGEENIRFSAKRGIAGEAWSAGGRRRGQLETRPAAPPAGRGPDEAWNGSHEA